MLTLLTSAAVLLVITLILCCTVLGMEIKERLDRREPYEPPPKLNPMYTYKKTTTKYREDE